MIDPFRAEIPQHAGTYAPAKSPLASDNGAKGTPVPVRLRFFARRFSLSVALSVHPSRKPEPEGGVSLFSGEKRNLAMKDNQQKGSQDVQSEGDYKSARRYKRDIDAFIKDRGDQIPERATEAKRAVEGPEANELSRAEEKGKSKARH
jgi:hypothetical protein